MVAKPGDKNAQSLLSFDAQRSYIRTCASRISGPIAMAKDTKAPDEMSSMTKAAIERVREGMNAYFDFLKQTISAYPSGGTEFGEKLKRHAEQNVTAVQEYVTKLSQAKTVQDAIQIQTEFMQTQFDTFGEQAKDLAEAYSGAVKSAIEVKPT